VPRIEPRVKPSITTSITSSDSGTGRSPSTEEQRTPPRRRKRLDLVQEFTLATRAEPGNIFFDWYRSGDDPSSWLLVEAFRDADAGKSHVESDHFRAAIAKLPDWLADVPEIVHVEAPGDGWAQMREIQIRA
jgi:quinol monooxygenase YgiN